MRFSDFTLFPLLCIGDIIPSLQFLGEPYIFRINFLFHLTLFHFIQSLYLCLYFLIAKLDEVIPSSACPLLPKLGYRAVH